MSKDLRLDRRAFLKTAGLGAGAALFLPSLAKGRDLSTQQRPRRIIFLLSELGWNPGAFRMKPPGAPEEVLWRSAYHPQYKNKPDELRWELNLKDMPLSEFSHTLQPLYELREHALVLDGLGMLSIGNDSLGDAHARGWNHALSGHPATGFITGQRAQGGAPSIDMRIARHLRQQDPSLTDLAALHFHINARRGSGDGVSFFHHFFYDYGPNGEIVKVPVEGNARRVFDRLFPGGSGPQTDPVANSQRDLLAALSERYGKERKHLSKLDRQKLDLHMQSISELKNRLDVLSNAQCAVPNAPLDGNAFYRLEADATEKWELNLKDFIDLTTVSFSCDLTRVVCLQLENSGGVKENRYGAQALDFHEWYSHGTNPPVQWRGVDGANVTEAEYDKYMDAAPVIANKNRFHVGVAAQIAQRLKEIPDGDGTLLDNTLIVLMDEISHGSHGHDQWPVVMLGGFGGAFRMGRYLRYPRINPAPGFNGSGSYAGVPHSHLLVSICRAMGLPLDDLGVQSVYARYSGYAGQSISLTGGLDGLI